VAAQYQEAHGIEVDFDVFEKMVPPDPVRCHTVYHATRSNFRLKAGSKAVDAVAIPAVIDGFAGPPDLGALQLCRAEPRSHSTVTEEPLEEAAIQRR
jgi:hypothetical protein